MSDSVLNSFVDACAGNVVTNILPHVVQYCNEQKGSITVEGLVSYLKLPMIKTTYTGASPVPASPFGGVVPQMLPSSSSSSKKQVATATPQPGKACIYQYKRGDNRGKFCSKPTSPGLDFCAQCLKTRKNLQKDGAVNVSGIAPGLSTGLPGYNPPVPASVSDSGEVQNGGINVVEFDESRGLFKEPVHGFIVKQAANGAILVIGKLSEDGESQEIVPLDEQEKNYAKSIGLILLENNVSESQNTNRVPVPEIPFIPQIPGATNVR